ncbi:hypothetical protein PM082_014929 [Marasmius tenuissimus]|nr:hypothetical protein PM082_014929 [Marasmius tenuissimus]
MQGRTWPLVLETGVQCNFFQRAPSSTPHSSPTSPSSTSSSSSTQSITLPSLTIKIPSRAFGPVITGTDGKPTCNVLSCGKAANNVCLRKSCAKHCHNTGGCNLPRHRAKQASSSPPPTQIPLPPSSQLTQQSLRLQQEARYMDGTITQGQHFINPQANPRFTSQMRDPYSTETLQLQSQVAKSRDAEAEKLAMARLSKQTVKLLGFSLGQDMPEIMEFQASFAAPHFVLTNNVIAGVGISADSPPSHIQYYNRVDEQWVKVPLGYVVDTTIHSTTIFIMDCAMTVLPSSFDEHLDRQRNRNRGHAPAPSARTSQRENRDAVRAINEQRIIAAAERLPSKKAKRVRGTPSHPTRKQRQRQHSARRLSSSPDLPMHVIPHSPLVVKQEALEASFSQHHRRPSNVSIISISSTESVPHSRPPQSEPVKIKQENSSHCRHLSNISNISAVSVPSNVSRSDEWVAGYGQQWPSEFFVCDVISFINKHVSSSSSTRKKAFYVAFGSKLVQSTYRDQRKRWKHAPSTECEHYLALGRIDEGKWSVFAKHHPLPDSKLKVARQKLNRATPSDSDSPSTSTQNSSLSPSPSPVTPLVGYEPD